MLNAFIVSKEVSKVTVYFFIIKIHRMIVVVALLFYVHGKHLRSSRDGQLT